MPASTYDALQLDYYYYCCYYYYYNYYYDDYYYDYSKAWGICICECCDRYCQLTLRRRASRLTTSCLLSTPAKWKRNRMMLWLLCPCWNLTGSPRPAHCREKEGNIATCFNYSGQIAVGAIQWPLTSENEKVLSVVEVVLGTWQMCNGTVKM